MATEHLMPRFTKEQLRLIIEQLRSIKVENLPVFAVQVINPHTGERIALDQIEQSGVVFLSINMGHAKRHPMWIVVPDGEETNEHPSQA